MVTNVSEKDKALQEVIDWCEQLEVEGLRLANALLMQHEMDAYGVVKGQINAYEKTADHCRSMLGYSGSMPSEVPNQIEDTNVKAVDRWTRRSGMWNARIAENVSEHITRPAHTAATGSWRRPTVFGSD